MVTARILPLRRLFSAGRAPAWRLGPLLILAIALLGAPAPEPRGAVAAAPSTPLDPSEPPNGALWVQNMVSIDPATTVGALFANSGGAWPFGGILLEAPPRSQDVLRIGTVAETLPPGQYAAHLAPNQPFPSAAIARNEWPATGAAVIYGAVGSDTGVTLPWVARRHGGARASSRVSIQNARTDRPITATIEITAIGAASATTSFTRTIPAGLASELDLARDPEVAGLPDGFAGSLRVVVEPGARPSPFDRLAASVTTELEASRQAAYAVAGTPDGGLADRLYAPRVARQHSEVRGDGTRVSVDSFIAVANRGPAPAAVTVTYHGSAVPGNACAGQTYVHGGGPATVPAFGALVFAQGDGLVDGATGFSSLPNGCLAAAVISTVGAPLAATVVEVEDGSRRAGAYEALVAQPSKRLVHVPLMRRGFEDLSTSVHAMNAGDSVTLAEIEITAVYVTATGSRTTVSVKRSASLEPGASAIWDVASFPEIPQGALGVAKVTSGRSGVPVVAVARETSDDGTRDNALYPAVYEPARIDHPAPEPDEYKPYYAPSVWHSRVFDLGLIAPASTRADQVQRMTTTLNAQAYDYARRTGRSIAVKVQPYVTGAKPNQQLYHDWLQDQIARGFPDLGFQARSWVVALNYNAFAILGHGGRLLPLDAGVFPDQGDFLDEAWSLNSLSPGDRPVAVPWLRGGCSPNFTNLALLAASTDRSRGFELMDYLTRPEQQRENYQPRGPGRSQIGHPTLKALYAELGISCPGLPFVLRTDPARVAEVIAASQADDKGLGPVWELTQVEARGDSANSSKSVGVVAGDRMVVAQPMMVPVAEDELQRLLRSETGFVAGAFSLWPASGAPTATPTQGGGGTPTATTPATPPTATALPSTPPTPTATVPRPTPVAVILLPYAAQSDLLDLGRSGLGASGPDVLAPPANRPASPGRAGRAQAEQDPATGSAYAVTWRRQPDGSVVPVILDENAAEIDPASMGITVEPVSPSAPRSPEPESWIQRGSTIVCFQVEQHQGCIRIEDP